MTCPDHGVKPRHSAPCVAASVSRSLSTNAWKMLSMWARIAAASAGRSAALVCAAAVWPVSGSAHAIRHVTSGMFIIVLLGFRRFRGDGAVALPGLLVGLFRCGTFAIPDLRPFLRPALIDRREAPLGAAA